MRVGCLNFSAFTTWLLGQLVLFLTEFDMESVYTSSKRAQIFILESMLSWTPCMFIQIVSFYLAAIEGKHFLPENFIENVCPWCLTEKNDDVSFSFYLSLCSIETKNIFQGASQDSID